MKKFINLYVGFNIKFFAVQWTFYFSKALFQNMHCISKNLLSTNIKAFKFRYQYLVHTHLFVIFSAINITRTSLIGIIKFCA